MRYRGPSKIQMMADVGGRSPVLLAQSLWPKERAPARGSGPQQLMKQCNIPCNHSIYSGCRPKGGAGQEILQNMGKNQGRRALKINGDSDWTAQAYHEENATVETTNMPEIKWGTERRVFGNENASQMNSGVMNVPVQYLDEFMCVPL